MAEEYTNYFTLYGPAHDIFAVKDEIVTLWKRLQSEQDNTLKGYDSAGHKFQPFLILDTPDQSPVIYDCWKFGPDFGIIRITGIQTRRGLLPAICISEISKTYPDVVFESFYYGDCTGWFVGAFKNDKMIFQYDQPLTSECRGASPLDSTYYYLKALELDEYRSKFPTVEATDKPLNDTAQILV